MSIDEYFINEDEKTIMETCRKMPSPYDTVINDRTYCTYPKACLYKDKTPDKYGFRCTMKEKQVTQNMLEYTRSTRVMTKNRGW